MWYPYGLSNRSEVFYHLCADADVDHVLIIHPGYTGFWFNIGVVNERYAKGILHDEIGSGQSRFRVPLADLPAGDDIVWLVDYWRAWLHRFEWVEHTWQHLIFNLDQLKSLLRDGKGLRRDKRDGLTNKSYPACG